jgi:hypothetical protein
MPKLISLSFLFLFCTVFAFAGTIWRIGQNNNSSSDLALGPSDYKKFLSKDFGFEDRYFLIGKSVPAEDFPYVLPGPDDTWGGTWGTSGWRTHEVNILFGIKELPSGGNWKLIIDLVDSHPKKSLLKVSVNSQQTKFLLKGGTDASLTGTATGSVERILEIPVGDKVIRKGGNCVTITVLEGSWVVFDHLRLEGPDGVILTNDDRIFIRSVMPAGYELQKGKKRVQPLLVDVEHLSGKSLLEVEIDGTPMYKTILDTARYQLEVPMPAVIRMKESSYRILVNGNEAEAGVIRRSPEKLQTLAD